MTYPRVYMQARTGNEASITSMVKVKVKSKGNDKVHPRTGHEGPEGK